MRVGPVDLFDGALHGLRMVAVIGSVGMVRGCNADKAQREASGKKHGLRRHLGRSLFRGVDRSKRSLRVRDEYVVAVFVLARREIFLRALALSHFIMALGVAAENSRRLPGRGENVR